MYAMHVGINNTTLVCTCRYELAIINVHNTVYVGIFTGMYISVRNFHEHNFSAVGLGAKNWSRILLASACLL